MTFTLFVPGQPKPTRVGSAMISKSTGKAFVKMRGTSWANRVAQFADEHKPVALLEGALWARLTFFLPKPTSGKAAKREYPTVRPDVDRLVAGILDALNGLVYEDDKLVVRLTALKAYADPTPGVRIEVGCLEG